MAEAAVESPRTGQRFFCHQCSVEINPNLPDYTCPQCESGFIEEMTGGELDESENDTNMIPVDPAAQFEELWERTFTDSFSFPRGEGVARTPPEETDNRITEEREARARLHPHRHPRITTRRFGPRSDRHPAIEGIINQLLSSLAGGALFQAEGLPIGMFQLHGNPGDYAWGADGLDTIVSQLLNQLEGTGAPPAEKGQIESLPHRKISKEQVDNRLQCSVCMEDFHRDEEVRCLPCQHYYHTDCIVPWLERHGTCPICRKDLNGRDTSEDEPTIEIPSFDHR